VTYPTGIILTQAPSIVETTHTKPRRLGHPPPHLKFDILKFEIHSRESGPRLCGHSQKAKPENPSGIILTEALSIVETTHTQQKKVGHPPLKMGESRP